MNKWFTSAWFEIADGTCLTESYTTDLHGPFETDKEREKAVDALLEENGEEYIIAIVRFDIEGEGVPEVVE